MREEKEIIQKNHNTELGLIKREAENKIRVLQSFLSKDPAKKAIRNPSTNFESSIFEEKTNEKGEKSDKNPLGKAGKKKTIINEKNTKKDEESEEKTEENQNLCEFLKENLNEALEREKKLLEKLDSILHKEAVKMNEKSEEITKKEVALRPEVERW